jgi:8-oxo-dGTP diphosphatase
MDIKQVFSYYPHLEMQSETTKFKFCPCCGTKYKLKNILKCIDCGYVLYRNPSPAVVVFIEKGNKVLLGQRNGRYGYNQWGFPGGFIEFNEDFLTAAHREVKEETNLNIEISSILNVVTNYISPSLHTIVIVLLAKVISGDMKPNDDLKNLKWYCLDAEMPDMAFESEKYIIDNIDNLRKSTIPIDNNYYKI